MRIIFDINHPGQVHLLKNLINYFKDKKYNILVTLKKIPAAEKLLKIYGINYLSLGKKSDTFYGKLFSQLAHNMRFYRIVKKNDIQFCIGTSVTAAHVSKITKMKSFILDDDDSTVQPLFVKFCHPFADYILSPECLAFERNRKNHITYAGYHELAYLHPNIFIPDSDVTAEIGLKPDDTYFVLRFNAFKAHHDIGAKGISQQTKRELIQLLNKKGKVFISTEKEIEPEFAEYKLTLSPEKIHSLLYYATMFIGDSQTMTSEAAVLGTPAIRSNSFVGKIAYLEEEEHRYGLTYGFTPDRSAEMIMKIDELLSIPNLKEEWQKRRKKMLADKIDVTAFLVWFVENYPGSAKIMKENPDYQHKFKTTDCAA